jgi:hypothetical protein
MQDRGYRLPRISLLRRWVNKGEWKGRGRYPIVGFTSEALWPATPATAAAGGEREGVVHGHRGELPIRHGLLVRVCGALDRRRVHGVWLQW